MTDLEKGLGCKALLLKLFNKLESYSAILGSATVHFGWKRFRLGSQLPFENVMDHDYIHDMYIHVYGNECTNSSKGILQSVVFKITGLIQQIKNIYLKVNTFKSLS